MIGRTTSASPGSLRRREPEWMDDPALDAREHREALRGLARLNRLARVARGTWLALRPSIRAGGRVHVLDLACGGGDVSIGIARSARASGRDVRVTGLDVSPTAIAHAADALARSGIDHVEFRVADVLADEWPAGADAIVSSLFLHHLDEADVCALLARCKEAAPRVLVMHDLERSPAGAALARWVTPVATRSRVVRNDAVASVRAAFRADELLALARRAGLHDARVERRFPARLVLEWSAP